MVMIRGALRSTERERIGYSTRNEDGHHNALAETAHSFEEPAPQSSLRVSVSQK